MSRSPDVDGPAAASAELPDLLLRLAGQVRGLITKAAKLHGLPGSQAKALIHLREPVAMRGLANLLDCDPSHVSNVIDGLERRGLVLRRPDPADRRHRLLVLTEEGALLRDQLRARVAEHMPGLNSLSPEESALLRRALRRAVGAASHDLPAA